MSKKFNLGAEMTKKFLSGAEEEQQPTSAVTADKKSNSANDNKDFLPESTIGKNRPKSRDRVTGEVTKQIGFFITDSQNTELNLLAASKNTNKSELVRNALRMYFAYLGKEGII